MDADEIRREIYRNMSPTEKVKIAMGLNIQARRLRAAWFRQKHPDWTEEKIQEKVKEIFLNARS